MASPWHSMAGYCQSSYSSYSSHSYFLAMSQCPCRTKLSTRSRLAASRCWNLRVTDSRGLVGSSGNTVAACCWYRWCVPQNKSTGFQIRRNGIAIPKAQPFVVCVFHDVFLWPFKVEQDVSWCFWISKESKDQRKRPMEFQPWDKWRLWEASQNRSEYGPDGRECQENSKQQSDCTFSSWIWDKRQVAIYLYKNSRSGYCIHGPCYPAIPTQLSSRCQNDTMSTWDPREYMRTPGS